MPAISRRQFIRAGTATLALAALPAEAQTGYQKLKIGVTDWNLQHSAKPTSVQFAKSIGFDGVEISLGRAANPKSPPDRLPLGDADLQEEFLAEAQKNQFPIASTCLDILHQNYLKVKSDPLGRKWVAESIPITKRLGARVILLPFFGRGKLETRDEMDYVADILKEMGPEAEKAGVILGIEDTISAEDNARILDRAQSKAVLVYYDLQGDSLAGQRSDLRISFEGQSAPPGKRLDRFSQGHRRHRRDWLHGLGAPGDSRSLRQCEGGHENESCLHSRAVGQSLDCLPESRQPLDEL
jgi:hypothetical protein